MIIVKITTPDKIAKFKNTFKTWRLIRVNEADPGGHQPPESIAHYYEISSDVNEEVMYTMLSERSFIDLVELIPDEMELPTAPKEDFSEKEEVTGLTKLALAADDITPSFISKQMYRYGAPSGIDSVFASKFPGGDGTGVKVVDIERGWNFDHEDNYFNCGALLGGRNTTSLDSQNHGTAVMGVIAGDDNGFGIKGIAPGATFYGYGGHPIHAVKAVADKLDAGDIIVIEHHTPGPATNGRSHPEQFGYCPAEIYQSVFDAIEYAVSKGIVVVEAGGNGQQDLDDSMYEDKFNRDVRDSGAIIVGASTLQNFPAWFTNHGSRIDVFAHGESVCTAGYGTLFKTEENRNRWYTGKFCGTSSATPIIAGACAIVNGILKARGEEPIGSIEMRETIRIGATNSGYNYYNKKKIGVMPNMVNIVKNLMRFPDYNDDDKVTFADFVQFAKYYTTKDLRADLNSDGVVNFNDYREFASHFGKEWN